MADVTKLAGRAILGYLATFAILSIVGTVIGSFILWEAWTPFDTIGGRMALAWLAIFGVIHAVLR